ncbi:hypothetical protein HDU83_001394 [Entophlyctis luteolus]|nr:hypothetical protein HDU83_001394 [Entophlyctis luteolus]
MAALRHSTSAADANTAGGATDVDVQSLRLAIRRVVELHIGSWLQRANSAAVSVQPPSTSNGIKIPASHRCIERAGLVDDGDIDPEMAAIDATIRLIMYAINAAPGLVFHRPYGEHNGALGSADSNVDDDTNTEHFATLSQLCASIAPAPDVHANIVRGVGGSAEPAQPRVPFDLWILSMMLQTLVSMDVDSASGALLAGKISQAVRLWVGHCCDSPVSRSGDDAPRLDVAFRLQSDLVGLAQGESGGGEDVRGVDVTECLDFSILCIDEIGLVPSASSPFLYHLLRYTLSSLKQRRILARDFDASAIWMNVIDKKVSLCIPLFIDFVNLSMQDNENEELLGVIIAETCIEQLVDAKIFAADVHTSLKVGS